MTSVWFVILTHCLCWNTGENLLEGKGEKVNH